MAETTQRDLAKAVWHVVHKPTGMTLCGQPRDGVKPAEGDPCNPCAVALYDVFGDLLDELEAQRALVGRVERVLDDEEANLADDGARLAHSVVRRVRAALATPTGGASDATKGED